MNFCCSILFYFLGGHLRKQLFDLNCGLKAIELQSFKALQLGQNIYSLFFKILSDNKIMSEVKKEYLTLPWLPCQLHLQNL